MFNSYKLVIFFFTICIFLSHLLVEVGFGISVLLAISIAIIFFKNSKYIFLFTLYCFFTNSMYSGNFFLFDLDIYITNSGMTNISNISFMAIVLIIIFQFFFKRDLKLIKIKFNNSIIKWLSVFILTQFIAVITSVDFIISINKFNQLPNYIIFFYISVIYLNQIKIEYILKFLGNISIIISAFYIYNNLILGEFYQDDGQILFVLPFLFNLILLTKNKFFIPFYSLFITFSIFLVDSRRFLIALFIYYHNTIYRILNNKSFYLISLCIVFISFFLFPKSYTDDSSLRIFDSLEILGKKISGEELDNADLYNLFTRRNILGLVGIEMFLEDPIFGEGLGMNSVAAGKFLLGDYTVNRIRLHNLYLELLGESGIFGGLSYLIILLLLFKSLWPLIKDINLPSHYRIASFTLFDIFIATTIINFFGWRGPYDKIEWFLYAFVYFLSISYEKIKIQKYKF